MLRVKDADMLEMEWNAMPIKLHKNDISWNMHRWKGRWCVGKGSVNPFLLPSHGRRNFTFTFPLEKGSCRTLWIRYGTGKVTLFLPRIHHLRWVCFKFLSCDRRLAVYQRSIPTNTNAFSFWHSCFCTRAHYALGLYSGGMLSDRRTMANYYLINITFTEL